ncbi:MAG TPA: hypothetical protein VHG08_20585 [Longimicrobium sp.]|nr:hypothetical protein [Longimicrobium sp.]
MITLSLADTEAAIKAAFDHWLDQDPHDFTIILGRNQVRVTIALRDGRFDCGTPGYDMAKRDVPALREWVPRHITCAGSVGALAACKMVGGTGQVNAYLLAAVTFNFHVNLDAPC